MPSALFFNVPAHGHINPSLPLVEELVKNGHHITYFASEGHRKHIEATGAQFRAYASIPDDFFEAAGLDGSRPQKAAQLLITTAGDVMPELLNEARALKPDYVIYDGMCVWGYMVGKALGVPTVASYSLLPIGTLFYWPMLRAMLPVLKKDFGAGLDANKRARAVAKQYSIPNMGMMHIMNAPADLTLSYTSDAFHYSPKSVPESVRFIGRVISDATVDPHFSFEAVNGRPLIYVSLGTVINDDIAFFKAAIEAFTGMNAYVMISTGKKIAADAFGTLPENIAVHTWVPQFDVLRRAALFVTHGGLNSVHDGLYFGVPLLTVPRQDEQTVTASRVVELGAGLMLRPSQVTAQSLRENAEKLLADPRYKQASARVGETFRAAGGVARGVREIEALLQRQAV